MAVILYLVVLVCLLVFFWLKYPQSLLSHIPGPKPPLLFGNYKDLVVEYYKTQLKWSEQYGPIFKYYFGRRRVVVVSSPELVYEVTQRQFDNFMNQRSRLLDFRCILFAHDDDWRFLRRSISPIFNTLHLKTMLSMMDNSVDSFMVKLNKCVESGEVIDIHKLFARMALEVIGETAFGTSISHDEQNQQGNELSVVANALLVTSLFNTSELIRGIFYELTPLSTKLLLKYPPKNLQDPLNSSNVE